MQTEGNLSISWIIYLHVISPFLFIWGFICSYSMNAVKVVLKSVGSFNEDSFIDTSDESELPLKNENIDILHNILIFYFFK